MNTSLKVNDFEDIKDLYQQTIESKENPLAKDNILRPGVKSAIEDYRRVVDNIVKLWGLSEFDEYIASISIQEKGSERQGFSFDILPELSALQDLHKDYMERKRS